MARFAVSGWAASRWGDGFPWGTLLVNALGALIIGWFAGWIADTERPVGESVQWFFMSGVCGGFTTFSAFSLQTFALIRAGQWPAAVANAVVSVVACVVLVAIGWRMGRGTA
jgi:CrcB protein